MLKGFTNIADVEKKEKYDTQTYSAFVKTMFNAPQRKQISIRQGFCTILQEAKLNVHIIY